VRRSASVRYRAIIVVIALIATEAHAWLDHKYENVFTPPYYEGTRWGLPASKEVLEGLQSSIYSPCTDGPVK
jgi:hypothetical protein